MVAAECVGGGLANGRVTHRFSRTNQPNYTLLVDWANGRRANTAVHCVVGFLPFLGMSKVCLSPRQDRMVLLRRWMIPSVGGGWGCARSLSFVRRLISDAVIIS